MLAFVPIGQHAPARDDVLLRIVGLKLGKIRRRIEENHGAQVDFLEELIELVISRCYDVDSGARDADAILNRTVLARISADLLDRMAAGKPMKKIGVTVKSKVGV
ncbi:hypothetical protein [Chitiniphilus eburneus]|uniref:hypothetical protein n=1 Tax=Chitiniphilus eburneus TaxID=2571148 RepID=UPI001FE3157A|nr:hypothetical protein [Chitiniphilus eburneus]